MAAQTPEIVRAIDVWNRLLGRSLTSPPHWHDTLNDAERAPLLAVTVIVPDNRFLEVTVGVAVSPTLNWPCACEILTCPDAFACQLTDVVPVFLMVNVALVALVPPPVTAQVSASRGAAGVLVAVGCAAA